ncbi:MAG: hypothetical protein IJU21_03950 [Bacteroidales bacterium]|nr:hypothetical protein [Bacteroidales bacterium]
MASRGLRRALLVTFLVTSCIIKEDRSACPCELAVHLSGPGPMEYRVEDIAGEVLHFGSVPRDTVVYCPVPRSRVRIMAASGAHLSGGIRIPYGSESPPLYYYHGEISARGEALKVNAALHKDYCLLTLVLDGPPGDGEPIGVTVRGSVDGIGLDGRPAAGDFSCNVISGDCRLPRQAPADRLLLDIVMEDRVVRTFALGTYIREAGYDWADIDLEDITIQISLSVTHISFRIGDWFRETALNIEI